MEEEQVENIHSYLMKELLPVSLGVFGRVKKEGLKKFLDDVNSDNNPIANLRSEGEPLASSFRDQLDKIQPGLGNPVITVEVTNDPSEEIENLYDQDGLVQILNKINERLDLLSNYLEDNPTDVESDSVSSKN